jgi:hypothetical protein
MRALKKESRCARKKKNKRGGRALGERSTPTLKTVDGYLIRKRRGIIEGNSVVPGDIHIASCLVVGRGASRF